MQIKVLSYDHDLKQELFKDIEYVYRHKVKKKKWAITDEFSNKVVITEDHSIMVLRDNNLIEIKPKNLFLTDRLISFKE